MLDPLSAWSASLALSWRSILSLPLSDLGEVVYSSTRRIRGYLPNYIHHADIEVIYLTQYLFTDLKVHAYLPHADIEVIHLTQYLFTDVKVHIYHMFLLKYLFSVRLYCSTY